MWNDVLSLPVWDYIFFGNTVLTYATSVVIFVGLTIIFFIFHKIILYKLQKLSEKTKTDIDDALVAAIRTLKPPFYLFLSFYLAVRYLVLSPFILKIISVVLMVWLVYQVVHALQILVDFTIKNKLKKSDAGQTKTALKAISTFLKIILWIFGGLLIMSNLGVDVTSLIAGLGIGGVAVALALKNILSDLFSSFVIYFDKPFLVGDFIKVGDKKGTVLKIGMKSTRIKTPLGEEVIIGNQELSTAQVQNFRKLEERRIAINIGVEYETPSKKLEIIPEKIKNIIESMQNTRVDRVHLSAFNASDIGFEAIYYFLSPSYAEHMDAQQVILLNIKKYFDKEGISFAYPTQKIFLDK